MTDTQSLDAQATKSRSSWGCDGDLVGMLADRDPRDGVRGSAGSITRTHRPAQSETKSWSPLRAQHDVVRPGAGRGRPDLLAVLEIRTLKSSPRRHRASRRAFAWRPVRRRAGNGPGASGRPARRGRYLGIEVGSGCEVPIVEQKRVNQIVPPPDHQTLPPAGATARPNQLCRTDCRSTTLPPRSTSTSSRSLYRSSPQVRGDCRPGRRC